MHKQNQFSHATKYNRYPEYFTEVKKIVTSEYSIPSILSFGCSDGSEMKSLSDIYFKESKIDGIDISKRLIDYNNKNNKNSKLKYTHDSNDLKKYDLIFCMSVLCVWPESAGSYYFADFEQVINDIDSHLNIGGYLCIYNSKYTFTDTIVSKNYITINTMIKNTGFVQKYSKEGIPISSPYYLFKKVKSIE